MAFHFASPQTLILWSLRKNSPAFPDFLHFLSAAKGLAEFELANHVLTQKTVPTGDWDLIAKDVDHANSTVKYCAANNFIVSSSTWQAAEGEEALPVPFRYNLAPARNGKCHVFKPNALRFQDGIRQRHPACC